VRLWCLPLRVASDVRLGRLVPHWLQHVALARWHKSISSWSQRDPVGTSVTSSSSSNFEAVKASSCETAETARSAEATRAPPCVSLLPLATLAPDVKAVDRIEGCLDTLAGKGKNWLYCQYFLAF
jgi:hypothetical protein